jgi:uncharacterized protein
MKFLLWAVIGFIVVRWLLRAKHARSRPDAGARAASGGGLQGNGETMIRCAQCGVYIPASEAIVSRADTAFCSEEHRLRHVSG